MLAWLKLNGFIQRKIAAKTKDETNRRRHHFICSHDITTSNSNSKQMNAVSLPPKLM